MNKISRRSWLLVPANKAALIARAAQSGADVVVLDLVEFVVEQEKAAARGSFAAALQAARAGGAEVFAQVDPTALHDDLAACVVPGLAGIVVTRAESMKPMPCSRDWRRSAASLPARCRSSPRLKPRAAIMLRTKSAAPVRASLR